MESVYNCRKLHKKIRENGTSGEIRIVYITSVLTNNRYVGMEHFQSLIWLRNCGENQLALGKKSSPNEFDSDCYYVDDECRRLEGIIRTRTEFLSCRVKRLSQVEVIGGNPPPSEDPFAVISSEETLIAWIHPWEFEALDDPDNLLAYLTVEAERIKIADEYDFTILVLGALIPVMALALVFSMMFSSGYVLTPFQSGFFAVLVLGSIISVLLFYRTLTRKRNLLVDLDIRYARETTAFREALRILASLSDHYEMFDITKYEKRYKIIEGALLT